MNIQMYNGMFNPMSDKLQFVVQDGDRSRNIAGCAFGNLNDKLKFIGHLC